MHAAEAGRNEKKRETERTGRAGRGRQHLAVLPPSTSSFVLQQSFSLPSLGAGFALEDVCLLIGRVEVPAKAGK